MRTCAVKPVGLAAGLRLCLESWRGSLDRRLLCVPVGASPALGRGVAATRRASGACSTPSRACRSSRSSAALKGSQGAGRVALNSRAACSPFDGSLTSSTSVNPSPPATTLKAVTPSAGESTAVNGRGGIAQGARDVSKSFDFETGRGSSDRRLFTQLQLMNVAKSVDSATGSERSSDPTRRSIDLRVPTQFKSAERAVALSAGGDAVAPRRGSECLLGEIAACGADASPSLGRGVAATRRASGACSTPNRALLVRSTSSCFSSALGRRQPCQRSGAAHGSLTSREFVNPSPPATTLKDVPTPAGESTAVNGRGGIAQNVVTLNDFNQGPLGSCASELRL